ncbi:MAG TPA: ISAs1 family transposase [Herpetosiphonaceae bacterium]
MYSTILPFAIDLPAEVPFAFCLQRLIGHLETLVDQRDPRGVRYPLAALLAIAVHATLAGASRVEALADWASFRAPDLARCFGLPRPTMPHARTWGRIFAHAVDPAALEQVLRTFFLQAQYTSEVPQRGSIMLAVDGKTLRGTIPAGQTKGVHLVAAYLPAQGVVLAQLAGAEKANEIVAVPQLIAQLDVTGMVVTGDAMQAQQALSVQIVESGGDYLWMVKENQPTLYADSALLFTPEMVGVGCSALPTDFRTARSVDNAHGRLEERVITVSSMLKDYSRWPYLEQVFKLERIVTNRRGKRSREVRYGVTSLPADLATAARLLSIARAEWGIENGLHYRHDVSLHEDSSRMRRGRAPHVFAALNNAVIGIVAQHGVPNLAKAQREFQYRIDRGLAHDARRAT